MCLKASGRKVCGGDRECEGCEQLRPEILPENREVVRFWGEITRCWRIGPVGGLIGLDYAQVATVAGWCGLELRNPRIRNGLMFLEELELERSAGK